MYLSVLHSLASNGQTQSQNEKCTRHSTKFANMICSVDSSLLHNNRHSTHKQVYRHSLFHDMLHRSTLRHGCLPIKHSCCWTVITCGWQLTLQTPPNSRRLFCKREEKHERHALRTIPAALQEIRRQHRSPVSACSREP